MKIRRKRSDGTRFWGCTGWPEHCNKTVDFESTLGDQSQSPSVDQKVIVAIVQAIYAKDEPAVMAYNVLKAAGINDQQLWDCIDCGLDDNIRLEVWHEYHRRHDVQPANFRLGIKSAMEPIKVGGTELDLSRKNLKRRLDRIQKGQALPPSEVLDDEGPF